MARISRRTTLGILGASCCVGRAQVATSTRNRVSLAGAWRFKPEGATAWMPLAIPDAWPRTVKSSTACYERDIVIPAAWSGRRITLTADCINSFAEVFVDGAKAGEMRYPAGELDLSPFCHAGRTHTLALEVTAMPLKAVMLSYSDTASARAVEGAVVRRGITGDVYLNAVPMGPRIAGVKVETSVRKGEIAIATAIEGAADRVIARVYDGDRLVKEISGGALIREAWRAEKLWDIHTPRNQYRLTVMLVDPRGRMLDEWWPVRFGFRELWIDGRDFRLNGARLALSATPLDNALTNVESASYAPTVAALRHFRSIGVNLVYTHNYGCEPGTHFGFEEVLRAADDEGMLVAFSQPHFGQYDWTASDAESRNGYRQHAAFYARVAGNHPSVVFYSTSHNGAGYSEDMNPEMLDGIHEPRDQWSARGAARALRAEAIIRGLDPSRVVYHHSGGNLGAMHTVNFYGNWIPPQEMDDWFEHWATTGVKPLFTCEYSVPFGWDWSMYRGWYQDKREFGSAVVPWEFHLAEWDAQSAGDRAYRISDEERANLRWEAEQFRQHRTWHRWDYPHDFGSTVFTERLEILARQFEQNWRAFRTWGLSANGVPWDIGNYWTRAGAPTAVVAALERSNLPLLAYIAGKPESFTSKDHNFFAGEAVEKQLIAINNSREPVDGSLAWHASNGSGGARLAIGAGEQVRTPLRFSAPAAGACELQATVRFGNETREDAFAIDVLARPQRARPSGRIAVFDPTGALAGLGTRVDAAADLADFDTLIVGKGALSVGGRAPDIRRVREGLKVIVFEQSAAVLERRFGFRVAQYGLRWVFPRVPGHALLAGLEERHLRDWRGESSLLPNRLEYTPGAQFNQAPTVEWAGIPVTRVWRAGNRGTVASVLIEKPACGDFLSIVDGGYALQYTPLAEYREGRGMVLFCQMDVSARTENDPAAEILAASILRYVSEWKPVPARRISFRGSDAGRRYLERAGVTLADDGDAIAAFGLDLAAASALVPGISMDTREHIAAHWEAFGPGSPFTGISPADVHCRDPRHVPLVTNGAAVAGNGVLAASRDGRVVLSALAPWNFDYSDGRMNVKRTFRNFARMTTRLMGNLGAPMRTPLLERFSAPANAGESRWLDGLYLDQPEEWDDPYRFFRW